MTEPRPTRARVECYAGYRGAEHPRRLLLPEGTVVVTAILERWRTPDHRCFRVRGEQGEVYLLRHAVCEDTWDAVPLRKAFLHHE